MQIKTPIGTVIESLLVTTAVPVFLTDTLLTTDTHVVCQGHLAAWVETDF